jgi:hypothetical protein
MSQLGHKRSSRTRNPTSTIPSGSGHCPSAETREIVLRVKPDFLNGIKLILPSSPIGENISLYNSELPNYIRSRPLHRGALRNVTNAGLDAMDAEVRETSEADADGEVVWS